jgi:GrpB-like predicted nucleotidyltransferase (UPF0157 family)
VHVAKVGSPDIARDLALRDRLRSDPAAAGEYEALKRGLAAELVDYRPAYTEGKSEFILRLTS